MLSEKSSKNLVYGGAFLSFLSARNRSGLSQAKAALRIGVTDAAVCQWETGKTKPRASLLPKVAEVYGCTIDELLTDQDVPKE